MYKNFWKETADKWPIAFLAPMDGYCDSAYRQVNKKVNPDIFVMSEFYSADGIIRSKFLASSVLPHQEIEKPLIIQIFWKDPEVFAQAGKIIESYGVSWIDINMGCPAKKIVKSWYGSGLMIDTDQAYRVVEALNKAVSIPVSVKTRLWWNGPQELINFVKWLESAGASLVTVHGRTKEQAYEGKADFSHIYELKKQVNIPIICNGDVQSYDDGMRKIHSPDGSVSLDGFMIGRASFGDPWCFVPWGYQPTLWEILEMMSFHGNALVNCKWEKRATTDIRKHLVNYLKFFPWVSKYRKRLVTIETIDTLYQIIDEIKNEFQSFLHNKPQEVPKQ